MATNMKTVRLENESHMYFKTSFWKVKMVESDSTEQSKSMSDKTLNEKLLSKS